MSIVNAVPQNEQSNSWMYYGQKAIDEYKAKNYQAFLDAAQKAVSLGPPRHPELMYQLARAYSLNGKTLEASKLLNELADMGLGIDVVENDDFKSLRITDEWARLSKRIAAVRTPLVRSQTAFIIPEPDLMPEGIAYDPKRRTFYLGSTYKSKIVSVDAAGRKADFTASGQDGLQSVLGMKVDAQRRLLWVCSNTWDGVAFVHKYNLDSGRLLRKYTLDDKPNRHLVNDITFNRRGDAYVTDSLGSAVYEIPADAHELRLLFRLEAGVYPNGIALSEDGKRLFVATLAGITLFDIGTKRQSELAHSENIALTGVDGLYLFGDSLIAVQNSHRSPDRVVRLFLSADGNRVEKARVIESNHPLYAVPTTGAIVGDKFFYIANSQITSLDAGGKLSPTAKLRDPILLKVNLN
jgi:hypothetical protein